MIRLCEHVLGFFQQAPYASRKRNQQSVLHFPPALRGSQQIPQLQTLFLNEENYR